MVLVPTRTSVEFVSDHPYLAQSLLREAKTEIPAELALTAIKKNGRDLGPARLASGVRPRAEQPEAPNAEEATEKAPSEPSIDDDARQLTHLLDEASQWLTRVPPGPLRAELAAMLQRYRRTLDEWAYRSPSETQRTILLHGVQILRRAIADRAIRPG
jgi:hypothetical protein